MLPVAMTIDELKASGYTFHNLLARTADPDPAVAALAKAALEGLDRSGFSLVPVTGVGKDAVHGKSQRQVGEERFHAFVEASTSRAAVGGKVAEAGEDAGAARKTLIDWVRGTHRKLVAIKRDDNPKALAGLPLLGELQLEARLREAARGLIKLLSREDVLAAVATYCIGPGNRVAGEQALAAWQTTTSTLGGTRGVRRKSAQADKNARDAYASWLTKWWDLARTELEDEPAVLIALGIEPLGRRGGGGGPRQGADKTVPVPVEDPAKAE